MKINGLNGLNRFECLADPLYIKDSCQHILGDHQSSADWLEAQDVSSRLDFGVHGVK